MPTENITLTFQPPQAIIVERRSSTAGKMCYLIGVTNGVRTVERFLNTHRPVLTYRTARSKRQDLQHDLDRGLIKPNRALEGSASRRATATDLTGFVPVN